ncbi:VOC family protein [Planomonospora parontospora]|uniref:VOC family protein n=1 Tax=Planomonospora parontospora TaxID=58119 RepID=UPI001671008C|nr:VOC family protein [Planomonospora parontospora]GGL46664.1 VOC family protein [Planomonospora parontospora subsp. antibiotica]GII19415.1 VOC family protein [Planomonospora parontospora subsp. antibiotica]
MSITTAVHLNFQDSARAALEFYQSVFGGRLVAFTNADAGSVRHPADAGRVSWGEVRADNGFHVMAYDVREEQGYDAGDRAFFVSVRGRDADEITAYWKGLSDGATVVEDLGPAGWSPLYGMLKDRFGVTWVLDVAAGDDAG